VLDEADRSRHAGDRERQRERAAVGRLDELHLVVEIDCVPVVEPRSKREPGIRAGAQEALLDGMPVRGVVHVAEEVEIGRTQRPRHARGAVRRLGELETRRDDAVPARLRVGPEVVDAGGSRVRPEVDPDAVQLHPPAAIPK
jgi:hypothetical protein